MLRDNRLIGVDILRIIACFMIVGIHSTPNFVNDGSIGDLINAILKSIYHVGLPIFFIISGYFILSKKITNITDWYIRRIIKLIVPFSFISFAHFLYFEEGSFSLFSIEKFIKLTFSGIMNVSIHFWFFYVILSLYIITPLLQPLISKIKPRQALLISLLLIVAQTINSNFFIFSIGNGTPNSGFFLGISAWFVYFFLGGLYSKISANPKRITLLMLFFIFLLITVIMTIDTPNEKKIIYNQFDVNGTMYIYSSVTFFLFVQFKSSLNSTIRHAIIKISELTYTTYLSHVLILKIFYNNLPNITMYLQSHNLHIVITIIVFLLSMVFSFAINPLMNFLIGNLERFFLFFLFTNRKPIK